MSSRHQSSFFVVSSKAGAVVQKWNGIRRAKPNGPYVKVHRNRFFLNPQIIELAHIKSDNIVAFKRPDANEQKLHISNPVNPRDIRVADGMLTVQLVEISSYSKDTTKEIYNELLAFSAKEPHKTTLRVDARVADKVIPMLIGVGGSNIRRLTGKAKAFTMQDDKHLFHIHAATQKEMLGAKIRLRKEIDRITNRLDGDTTERRHRHQTSKPKLKTPTKLDSGAFSALAEDDDEDKDEVAVKSAVNTDQSFPTIDGSAPPPLKRFDTITSRASLAEQLEDAIVRGETMDGTEGLAEVQARQKKKITVSSSSDEADDEMPRLDFESMTSDQIFNSACGIFTGSDEEAEWS